ncbi:MAG: hypothetical protein ACTSO6_13225 [Promethearchaeota archaeon]
MKFPKYGTDFLVLALRINKIDNGYLDFYFGPKTLGKIVDNESIKSPNMLLGDCKTLEKELFKQGFDKKREQYLEKMLVSMKTSIEILDGVKIPFKEQFLRLYDVSLEPVNESDLDNLKEEFSEAYGGLGSLEERMNDLRVRRKVPANQVLTLYKKALSITAKRTKELFTDLLPKKEKIFIKLVKKTNSDDLKWSYYEWYLGDFCSRLEINPYYNMYWTVFLSAAAHEGYPGHHTEFSVKEQRLYRELNQFEHSILILKSPKLIISEGIADISANVLFSYQDRAEIGLHNFCPDSSNEDSLDVLAMQYKAKRKQSLLWYNLAYHALIDEWSEDSLVQYAKRYEIFNQKDIRNLLKLISSPTYSTTAFSYNLGSNLIKNKYGEFPSIKNFRNLLINPILPSDLL